MKLNIISSTDRDNAFALKIAKHVAGLYQKQSIEAQVVTLKDFPLKDVVGASYNTEIKSVKEFNKCVLEADGIVFIIPEYNGSFPGILKLFVDYLPFPKAFEKLPMAFIGEASGAFGGLRAVEQFQMIANYRNAFQFPERVFIPRVSQEFSEENGLKDSFKQELLESQTKNFISFVKSNIS